jgi:hypothetical protein
MFLIKATPGGYAARWRGPGGNSYGPEVRDAALDGLAVRMDQARGGFTVVATLKARTPPAAPDAAPPGR